MSPDPTSVPVPRRALQALVAVAVAALLAVAPAADARAATVDAPPTEPPVVDEPLGVYDPELYEGSGDRFLRRYDPEPLTVVRDRPRAADTDRYAIVLNPDTIELVIGARTVRQIPRPTGGPYELAQVAALIDDDRWIEQLEPGVFIARAAVAQAPDTRLEITAPDVTELRLADRPDVFLGGTGGSTTLVEGVKVVGWDERTGDVDTEYENSRPFLLYTWGSRIDIADSELAYLGYDRVGAYGLSWRRDGASGSVVDSDVHHLLFGMYSFEAADIELRGSEWHDCVYYGIDPHDYSTGLLVVDNEVYDNGSHGIIFSRGVNGIVRDNRSVRNGGNGIVMDFESDDSVIEGNLVADNGGDGIVILRSSRATVRDNVVRDNRVGLRVNLPSADNVFAGNLVERNRTGVQLYDGARGTLLRDNEVRDSARTGVVADEADTVMRGGVVSGTGVGVDVRGIATVADVEITDVNRGVEVRSTGIAQVRGVDVTAAAVGVQAEPGSTASLEGSTVRAADPIEGDFDQRAGNDLSQPFAAIWLVWAGGAFMVCAVVLQVLSHLRNRETDIRVDDAPAGVTNVR